MNDYREQSNILHAPFCQHHSPRERESKKPSRSQHHSPRKGKPKKPSRNQPHSPLEAEPKKPSRSQHHSPLEAEPKKPSRSQHHSPLEAEPKKPSRSQHHSPLEGESKKPSRRRRLIRWGDTEGTTPNSAHRQTPNGSDKRPPPDSTPRWSWREKEGGGGKNTRASERPPVTTQPRQSHFSQALDCYHLQCTNLMPA